MLVLGPNVVRDGLNPATALLGSGSMAMLGPCDPQSPTLDPIHRIFLLVGKIIAIRRVIMPEVSGGPSDLAIETLEGVDMATLKQSTDGSPDDYAAWDVVYRPLGDSVAARVSDMQQIGPAADVAVQRLVGMESARILGLDPALSLSAKVQAVIDYMAEEGLSVEAEANGMRDHLMRLFNDAEGLPAAFPSSIDPTFPDSWITPEVLTPVNNGRAWFVLL